MDKSEGRDRGCRDVERSKVRGILRTGESRNILALTGHYGHICNGAAQLWRSSSLHSERTSQVGAAFARVGCGNFADYGEGRDQSLPGIRGCCRSAESVLAG